MQLVGWRGLLQAWGGMLRPLGMSCEVTPSRSATRTGPGGQLSCLLPCASDDLSLFIVALFLSWQYCEGM
jgi:hypothetical protein